MGRCRRHSGSWSQIESGSDRDCIPNENTVNSVRLDARLSEENWLLRLGKQSSSGLESERDNSPNRTKASQDGGARRGPITRVARSGATNWGEHGYL